MALSSSSSSSSSVVAQKKYDVFISFRGVDTRQNFMSHLHAALLRKKIHTFIDDQLNRGDEISLLLLKTIEESKVSVVIFSENYADSTWCLDELVHILKCKKENGVSVIPVFYNIDPSHVRKQEQSYHSAFARLEKRFEGSMDKVKVWRAALTEAANLSGWNSAQDSRPESKLVEAIVEDILKKLNHTSSCELKGLVGIEERIQKIESLLCLGSLDFSVVGIWGMGGIGKTTIAAAVFERFSSQFEGCCFLANVREQLKNSDAVALYHLRKKLFSRLLDEENLDMDTPFVPSTYIDRLRRKRVLVVLDDVNKSSQLEFLVGKDHCFGRGSRIIITTRDVQVLSGVDKIYKVEELDYHEALQLFHLNALKDSNAHDCIELSKRVVKYTKGIPLALKVLGSLLCCRNTEEWEGFLNKLIKVPNMEIQNVLKISFDELDVMNRDIFLDIACFFKGKDRDYVERILNGCDFFATVGIRDLIEKSLITVLQNNMIWMHDLVQEMGWEIVRQQSIKEPGNRSRLWIAEDVYHVLKNNTGTAVVEGIFLDMSKIKEAHLIPTAFSNMHNLRLLKFYNSDYGKKCNVHLPRGLQSLPDTLRYLHWYQYPLRSLPSNFNPESLVELTMPHSKLEKLWDDILYLKNLREVNLSFSKDLFEVPDFSLAPNLKRINLQFCENLRRVPSNYEKVTSLDLKNCYNLKIPEISGNVEYLDLTWNAVEELPSSVLSLNKLVSLDLRFCKGLKNLPISIRNLKSLKYLYLYDSLFVDEFPELPRNIIKLHLSRTSIQVVPSSIEHLSHLVEFHMGECERLETLPTSICKLQSLESLSLWGCSNFENFPEILESMECLHSLDLSFTAIKELPESIDNLMMLKKLEMSFCTDLHVVPDSINDLIHLESLDFSGLLNIQKLPLLVDLYSLTKLNLSSNNIKEIPESLGYLPSLVDLNLRGCCIESLPSSIKQLESLLYLDISNCTSLQSLPSLPLFLQDFSADGCKSLKMVSSSMTATSEDWHYYYNDSEVLGFSNCENLSQNACNNIEADAKLRMLRMATVTSKSEYRDSSSVSIYYPRNEIPKWFNYQTMGSSITINLPPQWCNTNFLGFAVCAVVAFHDYYDAPDLKFRCEFIFKTNNGDGNEFKCWLQGWGDKGIEFVSSEHVFLMYDYSMYLHSLSKKDGANRSTTCYDFTEASFELYPVDEDDKVLNSCNVEMSGICLLYALDSGEPVTEHATKTKRRRDDFEPSIL